MYQPYGNQITLHKSPKDVKEKFTGKEYDQDGPSNYYVDFDIAISGHTPSLNHENDISLSEILIELADGNTKSVQFTSLENNATATLRLKDRISFSSEEMVKWITVYLYQNETTIEYYRIRLDQPLTKDGITKIALNKSESEIHNSNVNYYQVSSNELNDTRNGVALDYFGKRYYDADIGRWTSVDPAKEFSDLYSYTGGNPILLIDKQGLDCKVSVKGSNVYIQIPITSGENINQDTRIKFEAGVEGMWTGKFGKYEVHTIVTEGITNHARIVEGLDRPSVTQHKNLWLAEGVVNKRGASAHEAGHLMNLPDQYHDTPTGSIPNKGYENNIMGTTSGKPNENDITQIINKNK
jgi:RHS repeat-associated protein